MDNNKINKMIEEYVGYVYGCDGYMLPEEDDFFGDMLARHHCGSEDARAVVRRIEELGLGQFRNNDLSLSPLGILMYEQCGNSVDRFIRRDQERVDAESRLPARQLKSINGSVVRSWISIAISLGALAVSIIAIVLKRC
ncbi:MAG: hypothetical protein IJK22_04145 [Bacteroidales bacterium]|nr:hypothetical protein [Bacteroidales bacterium]